MTSNNLLLSPRTRQDMDDLLASAPQAILIVGPPGAGKKYLARHVASRLLNCDLERPANTAKLTVIKKQENLSEISIDEIRALIRQLRVKSPGSGISRAILIEDAHYLSPEGQNAFLKTLEQPNPDTVFIITSANLTRLLPTLRSRLQSLYLRPVGKAEAADYFKDLHEEDEISSAWALSQGYPGLMKKILEELDQHELKLAVNKAKKFLKATKIDRLVSMDGLAKDKKETIIFLQGLLRVLTALHHTAIVGNNPGTTRRLLRARRLVQESEIKLAANTSSKLVLINLVLNLEV